MQKYLIVFVFNCVVDTDIKMKEDDEGLEETSSPSQRHSARSLGRAENADALDEDEKGTEPPAYEREGDCINQPPLFLVHNILSVMKIIV